MLKAAYPRSGHFLAAGSGFGILFDQLSHQPGHFTGFGVTVGLEFGIYQTIVYFDLELASV